MDAGREGGMEGSIDRYIYIEREIETYRDTKIIGASETVSN